MENISRARRWAARLYPKQIELFEDLNKNVLFNQVVAKYFSSAQRFGGRYELYDFVNGTILLDEPVRYFEFGVWQGASISNWAKLNRHADSRFYGFDTFEGLPEDWNRQTPKGSFQLGGNVPVIDDERVTFVKGLFQRTLPSFLGDIRGGARLVVHIDCDLYSSTLFCLTTLDKLLTPGSVIIFDEFRDLKHEFSAFWDYVRSFYRNWEGVAFTECFTQVAIVVR